MYGKFCGPYWSDGKWQSSVIPTIPADDELDQTCRDHDEVYARGGDLRKADSDFFWRNFGNGVLGTLFAIPVGMQYLLRAGEILGDNLPKTQESSKINTMPKSKQTNKRGNLRKSPITTQPQLGKRKSATTGGPKSVGTSITRSYPSTSIGTTISTMKPIVTRTNETARIIGRDFIGTVEGNGTSTFGLGKSALLSPAYFQSAMLGNLARSFERYRWNTLRVHYVPKVATSAAGQVVMCSSRSVTQPCLQGEAGSFLPRAMSQGNAIFTPLWAPAMINIDCTGEFKLVDSTTSVDLDDTIHEELQVYTQVGSSGQVGYLYAEYDVSFEEPIFQPHSTAIPYGSGPGARMSLADKAAINSSADALIITDTTSVLGSPTPGTIYRAVFDRQGSTAPTGVTFTSGFIVYNNYHSTTTAFATVGSVLAFVGGLTLYLVNTAGAQDYTAYTSMEAAIAGSASGQVYYNGATTVKGAYLFDAALVRIGVVSLPTIQ